MQAPRESDLVSSEDASNAAAGSSSGSSKDDISSFVDKKVGGRERKIRDQLYKIGLPGKSILGDYFQENRTS